MTAAKKSAGGRKKPGPKPGTPMTPQQAESLAKAVKAAAERARSRPNRTETKAQEMARIQASIDEAHRRLEQLAAESGVGKPTSYRPEFAKRATDLCMLGLTNAELGERFGVHESTIKDWIYNIPEFGAAVYEGREGADQQVTAALFKNAKGYEHPEDDIRTVAIGNNQGSEIVITPTVKRYKPDNAAAALWLANRQRARWKHFQSAGFNAEGEGGITTEDLAAATREAIRAALSTQESPTHQPAAAEGSSEQESEPNE